MLGEFQLFTWKSKATVKREQEEYGKWAFPYGQKQRDNLTELLLALFPREPAPQALVSFLTCRELYEGVLKNGATRDEAINRMINGYKKYKSILRKKDMPLYLALVLANELIDEECVYPSADEIKTCAAELEKLRPTK